MTNPIIATSIKARSKGVNPLKEGEKRGLWWYLATWFGCGLSPIMSGTAGSLGALPFAFYIHYFYGGGALFFASIAIFIIGVWASNQYLAKMQSSEDPGEIVIDEVAGQWLILSVMFPTWESYLVGFILFRAFDIVKPWPVCLADRKIKGGFGVMFDDMVAGAYPIILFWLFAATAAFINVSAVLSPIMQFIGGGYGW